MIATIGDSADRMLKMAAVPRADGPALRLGGCLRHLAKASRLTE